MGCIPEKIHNETESESVSRSIRSNSLQSHGLKPPRLLCPWNSPGKNTGMGSHSLFWGSSRPRDRTQVFCIAGRFFFTALQGDSLLFEPLGKSLWGVNILQLSFPFYAVQGHLQRLTKWNFKSWVLFAMYLTNTISYSPKNNPVS